MGVEGENHIISGDVISLRENLAAKVPGCNTWSAQRAVEGICRLEHLSLLLNAGILPSHDITEWEKFKKIPEGYRRRKKSIYFNREVFLKWSTP